MFLAGADKDKARVGELDEEMVFEARAGETFLLGASTWRIDQITHDRVLVSPAPGEPGKMPFWKGEGPGRPVELGMAIGKLVRELRKAKPAAEALARLERDHGLDALAAANLLQYLDDQQRAAGAVPDDRTIVIERSRDELGDWRVAVLSPLGSRVHAPWAMAVTARIRDERGARRRGDVVRRWVRGPVPEGERRRTRRCCCPIPTKSKRLVVRQLGSTAHVRGALPRSGRARAAAAPPAARRARAAVAAAQARRGSAGGRRALRIVPDHPRDLSRVPARHLRPAGARRHPAPRPQPLACAS